VNIDSRDRVAGEEPVIPSAGLHNHEPVATALGTERRDITATDVAKRFQDALLSVMVDYVKDLD
jgi:hypothetical protein